MDTPNPHDAALAAEAMQALPVCIDHCTCPDRWHVLWCGNKAAGQARMMHAQQHFLQALLPHYLRPAPRVLIAGAADTGSLDTLSAAIADPGTRYTVMDLCPAPLALVHQRAAQKALAVDTLQLPLEQAPIDRAWDLVFIHYTLSFMTAPQRLAFLERLVAGLAPGGTVVCAVREKRPPPQAPANLAQLQRERAAAWAQDIAPRFEALCSGRPEWLKPLMHWLPAYAQARMEREDSMPSAETVSEEFTRCGFVRREAHRNPGLLSYGNNDLSPPGTISTWIGVFQLPDAR